MGVRANSSRERILASAEEIILQKGFSATSIEDILDKGLLDNEIVVGNQDAKNMADRLCSE